MILRNDNVLPVAERSKRDSIKEASHSESSKAITTVTGANSKPSTLVLNEPTRICISSSCCSNRGNKPLIHSTTPIQITHDTVRSSTRAQRHSLKVKRKIFTSARITSSAKMAAKANRNNENRNGTRITSEAA